MKQRWLFIAAGGGVLASLLFFGFVYFYLVPRLPSIESLRDVHFQVPLRVYSTDGKLIAEFGEKKRLPLAYEEVPELLVKAILAAEDDRYFQHPGVDYQGILRAVFNLAVTGEKSQGGSTITMQVARNFFLTSEKTYLRKVNEILLAFQIEGALSKQEILQLYLNKIYLGNRAYGVGAAAQVYYGMTVDQLTLDQIAMIAGLPKAPSRYNPIADPERALTRRNYVLRRMLELDYITEPEYERALAAPVRVRLHGQAVEAEGPYMAEMVRLELFPRYGEALYTEGYRVYTTIDSRMQNAANRALRRTLHDYDQRHGYRGPEGHVELSTKPDETELRRAVADRPLIGDLVPAIVTAVHPQEVSVYQPEVGVVRIAWDGLSWARRYLSANGMGPAPKTAGEILKVGDIVRVLQREPEGTWRLSQVPAIEGALVALAPNDGAVRALVGGFDFFQSTFNRTTQGGRQPGSSFKPFIYAAAIDHGYTPATLVNDAPVVFEDPALETSWRPENFSGEFRGPTRLREALVQSRNLVSIRVLRDIGIDYAIDYATRFGFERRQLPRDLSLALGSCSATPLQLAAGYAVFANGGYRVTPYFLQRLDDMSGKTLFETKPITICRECEAVAVEAATDSSEATAVVAAPTPAFDPAKHAPRVISAQTAYLMRSMMRDVVRRGTAARAMELGRNDLAGKTGTTNDQYDAWFSGFNSQLVAAAWVGFDKPQPLGGRETGSQAALPMWIDFMREALRNMPESWPEQPPGLVTMQIDPESGLPLTGGGEGIYEVFRADNIPQGQPAASAGSSGGAGSRPEQLF